MTTKPFDPTKPVQTRDVRKQKMSWLNIYPSRFERWTCCPSPGYKTKQEANDNSEMGRIACIEITYEKGQGL